ncbi:hypothetical protein CRYUN_Cryun18bG0064000 [Craigia yunnanensis]
MYASSKCYFEINLNLLCKPSEISYILIPTIVYFEFFPMNEKNGLTGSISESAFLNDKEKKELVDLVNVKLRQDYELVVSTYVGLYPYRVEDILRVSTPIGVQDMWYPQGIP